MTSQNIIEEEVIKQDDLTINDYKFMEKVKAAYKNKEKITVPINMIQPGQYLYSEANIERKAEKFRKKKLLSYDDISGNKQITGMSVPVVIIPNGLVLIDNHHGILGAISVGATHIDVDIKDDYSKINDRNKLLQLLQENNYVFLGDKNGILQQELPGDFKNMQNEPARELVDNRLTVGKETKAEEIEAGNNIFISNGLSEDGILWFLKDITVKGKGSMSYFGEWRLISFIKKICDIELDKDTYTKLDEIKNIRKCLLYNPEKTYTEFKGIYIPRGSNREEWIQDLAKYISYRYQISINEVKKSIEESLPDNTDIVFD